MRHSIYRPGIAWVICISITEQQIRLELRTRVTSRLIWIAHLENGYEGQFSEPTRRGPIHKSPTPQMSRRIGVGY